MDLRFVPRKLQKHAPWLHRWARWQGVSWYRSHLSSDARCVPQSSALPCVPGERYSPEYPPPPPPATCSQFSECEYAKIPNTPEQSSIGFQTRLTDRGTATQMLSVLLPVPAYARTHADTAGTQERASQSLKPSLALPIPDPTRPHFLVQEPQRCAPCSRAYS